MLWRLSKFRVSLVFATGLVVALGFGGCAQEAENRGGGKKTGAGTDDAPSDGDDADADDGGSAGDEDDGGSSEGGDDKTLEQVLKECGGSEAAEAGPNDVIYEKEIKSLPIVKKVLIITVALETDLKIKVTGAKTVQDANVQVTSLSGLFSGLAKTEAEKQALANSGVTTLTNVPIADYAGLSDNKEYEGIICTIVPATKVDNRRGGKKTVALFDPPVPSSISPRAMAGRYAEELGKERVIDNIKVKITESDNEALQGKESLTGKVTIEKVKAEGQFDDGAGGTKTIKADLAYRVSYDFGSPEATYALGFPPVVTYFIDHDKKDLKANVVDTTDVQGGIAVFIHP